MNLITIQLNGQPREVPEGSTLVAVLEWLKLPADRVAVELNQEIVPRRRWPETQIRAGDRLEVVHFVGGGATDLCQRPGPAAPRATFSGRDAS